MLAATELNLTTIIRINDKQTANDPHGIKLGERDHPGVLTCVAFTQTRT